MERSHIYAQKIQYSSPVSEEKSLFWLTARSELQYLPAGVMYAGKILWRPSGTPFWQLPEGEGGYLPALGWFWRDSSRQKGHRHLRAELSAALCIAEDERKYMERDESWKIPDWSALPTTHFSLPAIEQVEKGTAFRGSSEFIISFTRRQVREHLATLGCIMVEGNIE